MVSPRCRAGPWRRASGRADRDRTPRAQALPRLVRDQARDAVFEALRRLYSLPRMPTNPYFFVATALSAHSAHGQRRSVWAVPDEEVLEWMEEVALVDGTGGASSIDFPMRGLPHVLRCCDREGLTDLRALLRKFPPACPKPERVEDYDDPECTRVVCMGLQDGCLHRRAWNGAPARMGLRHDIIVDGPEMAGAADVRGYHRGHRRGRRGGVGRAQRQGVLLKPGGRWTLGPTRTRGSGESVVDRGEATRGQDGVRHGRERATSHHKVAMECTVRVRAARHARRRHGTAAAAAAQRAAGP